jgi:hypothetical protein
MSIQMVHFPAVLPISVGHDVEVRVYTVEEGVFSKAWTPKPGDPWIHDRTTGVVYGSDWHFQTVNTYRSGDVMPQLPMEPRSDLRVHAQIIGKVRACRVVWIGGGDSRFPQTTLAIDTGAAAAQRLT